MRKPEEERPEPIHHPLGNFGHHTDEEFTEEDKALGSHLAEYMGTLFKGVSDDYWHHGMTSEDEWRRVVRALRIHELRIVNNRG